MFKTQGTRAKRIFSAVSAGLLVELFNKLSPLIMLSLAQKRLGIESFGQAQFGISLIEMAIPFVIFGYTYQGAIQFSQVRDSEQDTADLVSNIFYLRLIHASLISMVLGIFTLTWEPWAQYRYVIFAVIPLIMISAVEMTFINIGSQRMSRLSIWMGLFKALSLLGVYVFVQGPDDAAWYALLTLVAGSLVGLASFFWVVRYTGLKKPNLQKMGKMFWQAIAFAGVVFMFPIFERFDIFLIENLGESTELGYYLGPWRIAMSLVPFFGVICNTFLSEALATKNSAEFRTNTLLALFLCFAFALPICAAIPFVGADILQLIFDERFRAMNPVFWLICFSVVLEAFVLIFGMQVLLLNKQILHLTFALFITILSGLVAGFFAMQQWGVLGAAIGSISARFLLVLWLVYQGIKIIGPFSIKDLLAVAVSSLIMMSSLYLVREQSLVLSIAVGFFTYVVAMALLNRDKFALLRKLKGS